MLDMNELMRKAQKFQEQMQKNQEALAGKEFEGSAGGDMVTVKINGKMEVLNVKIAKEVVSPDDIDMLEDLVAAACNAAIKKVSEENNLGLKDLTKGMNLPPGII